MNVKGDRQYAQCLKEQKKLIAFKKRLEKLAETSHVDASPEIALVGSRIESLSRDLERYRLLNCSFGTAKFPALEDITNLATSLRDARIAVRWSQTQLAEQLELTPQQINRYEKTAYTAITLPKAIAIGIVLERELKAECERELRLRERIESLEKVNLRDEG